MELQNQADSQWKLLVDNDLTGKQEMVAATKAATQAYAKSLLRSRTELILAVGSDGNVAMSTSPVAYQGNESRGLPGWPWHGALTW